MDARALKGSCCRQTQAGSTLFTFDSRGHQRTLSTLNMTPFLWTSTCWTRTHKTGGQAESSVVL